MDQCTYKYGKEPVNMHTFRALSCEQCINYLSLQSKDFSLINNISLNFSPKDLNRKEFNEACNVKYQTEDCSRIWQCCFNAVSCCEKQLKFQENIQQRNLSYCPMVWDGFTCWNATLSGNVVFQKCPQFLLFTSNHEVSKNCLWNGTWQTSSSGLGWSDYSQCTDIQTSLIPLWIEIIFLLMSIFITLPAIVLLASLKKIRSPVRIRLHILLLLTLTARSCIRSIWDFSLILPALSASHDHRLSSPSKYITGCLILRTLLLYLDSVCFFCFLLEGIYLFRLIKNSLKKPKHMLAMSISFFILPMIFIGIYFFLRINLNSEGEDECWIGISGHLDWIHLMPNFICVVINIGLLLYILLVLVKRFIAHNRDVANIKRTVKAFIVLVPLFGIQILCTIYRVENSSLFSIFSSAVYETQAIWASINLSYINKEVRIHFTRESKRIKTSIENRFKGKRPFQSISINRNSSNIQRKFNATI